MAHAMDIKIIAEGAETKEQVEFLRDNGCDYIQGYYFYKPMPEEEFVKLLDAGRQQLHIIVSRKLHKLLYMGFQNPVFAVDNIETAFMSRFLQRKDKNLLCPLQVSDRA